MIFALCAAITPCCGPAARALVANGQRGQLVSVVMRAGDDGTVIDVTFRCDPATLAWSSDAPSNAMAFTTTRSVTAMLVPA